MREYQRHELLRLILMFEIYLSEAIKKQSFSEVVGTDFSEVGAKDIILRNIQSIKKQIKKL